MSNNKSSFQTHFYVLVRSYIIGPRKSKKSLHYIIVFLNVDALKRRFYAIFIWSGCVILIYFHPRKSCFAHLFQYGQIRPQFFKKKIHD